jgi:uncharacterized protein YkwD
LSVVSFAKRVILFLIVGTLIACTGEIVEADLGGGPAGIDGGPGDPPRVGVDGAVDTVDAAPASYCGDDMCDSSETCGNCGQDCGVCQAGCGDGMCNAGEDCSSCADDCGVCGGSCGDGICNGLGGETCTACAEDCNNRDPVCGNGECQMGETPQSCRPDCGPAEWSLSWAQWEEEVVALINQERAAGTDCPNDQAKDPVGPLIMNEQLRTAARLHSWDMSVSSYFNHTSCNGRSPWVRAAAQGHSATGETIGGSYPSPAAMVNGWMNSSGHCNILMSGSHSLVGLGYANEGGGNWTGLFR